MSFREAVAELDARQPERMVPDLSRITALAELLDHPELTYPSIHVTGTNGKTTTARLISTLACAHGINTGMFTSPHLESVTERLTLCGDPIQEEEFAEEYGRLLPFLQIVDGKGELVTYFETLTALAYLWFADKPVSLGVFEVGMGGVWDATNLITGDVAVLSPIALDHPELGSTVEEVAGEKVGIIKEGKLAVSREQSDEALKVIDARCRDMSAHLFLEGRDFGVTKRTQAVGAQYLSVRGINGSYDDLLVPLFGESAARNAAAAIVALEAFLERALDLQAVGAALSAAVSPGRMEVVTRHPLIVLDGAHNPSAARVLARAVSEAFVWDRLFLVLAVSANKDVEGVVKALAPLAKRAYVAAHSSPRSAPAERTVEACSAVQLPAEPFGSVEEALDAARLDATETDLILVAGSLYTVADARRVLVPNG
jgi:dihydrofolate synthase/folylpolyglutamate synthase